VQQGNMFLDQKLSVSAINKVTATVQNPFLKALQTTERNWAFQSSEIPLIQQHLTSQGLTGQGIKIGILDDLEDDVPEHTKTVTSAINDPRTGIAPQAAVTLMGGVKNFVSHAYPDDLEFYKRLKTDLLVWDFFQMAETINRAIAANDPQLRVLSLTQGIERNLSSFKLYEFLNEKNETGLYKKPRIRQALLGDTVLKGPDAQLERACQFTNQIFDSPQVTAARNSYLQATKNAAERGITIVASAGNSNRNVQPFAYPHVPGMELNEFAKSPDVICVAMSDSNQTPGFYADDRISRISSTGDGLHYNPTVSAPGQNIPFLQSSPKMAPNGVLIGTSYSTPYVAGLIALMLQQNPNLTFWDIKRKLQQTATLLPGYTVAEQGAGVVNPFKALGVSYY